MANIKAAAKHQQYVRVLNSILDREIAGARADGAGPPAKERVIRGDQVMRPGGCDRDAQVVDNLVEELYRSGQPDPCPCQDHRTIGILQPLKRLCHVPTQLFPGAAV